MNNCSKETTPKKQSNQNRMKCLELQKGGNSQSYGHKKQKKLTIHSFQLHFAFQGGNIFNVRETSSGYLHQDPDQISFRIINCILIKLENLHSIKKVTKLKLKEEIQ